MPPTTSQSDGISLCMKNATDWLNDYGINNHLAYVVKYCPDVAILLQKRVDRIDELWARVRNGDKSLVIVTKVEILDWFISWRILIDSVRGLQI